MSSGTATTPEEAWRAIEATVLAVGEHRIDALTSDEVRVLLKDEGFDVAALASTRRSFLAGLDAELEEMRDAAETDRVGAMSGAEVKAGLLEEGFDLAAVEKTSDAFLAGLNTELDAMEDEAAEAPSNVIPFRRPSSGSTRFTMRLLTVAAAATLAMTQAAMVAMYDPAAVKRAQGAGVFVDVHAQEVDRAAGAAMDAAATDDWDGCLAHVAEVTAVASRPQPDVDQLDIVCRGGKADELVAGARAAAAEHRARACQVYMDAARDLGPIGVERVAPFIGLCSSAWEDGGNAKAH